METSTSPEHDERRPKRRKIALACGECRDRKRKCDGVKPVCGSCSRRKPRPACVFTDESLKRGSSSYVESLRARIRELEKVCGKSVPTPESDNASTTHEAFQTSNLADYARAKSHSQRYQTVSQEHSGIAQLKGLAPPLQDGSLPQEDLASLGLTGITLDDHLEIDDTQLLKVQDPPANSSSMIIPILSTNEDLDDGENDYVVVDAMGAHWGSPVADCKGPRRQSNDYFGPSSAVGFMSQVQCAVSSTGDGSPGTEVQEEIASSTHPRTTSPSEICGMPSYQARHPPSTTRFRAKQFLDAAEYSIPPRREADILVESYLNGAHSLYPFLHRASFIQRYLQIWEPERKSSSKNRSQSTTDDRLFYCQLNAVFALGSHFSPFLNAHEKISTSKVFHDRSRRLLGFNLLARGSIELVQTLLLMAQYLQSTEMSGLCWNVVGLAIRVAQSIGLHLRPSDSTDGHATRSRFGAFESTSQIDIEMRRRVWGGCITLDIVLSMIYGRPMMIHPSQTRSFSLPSVVDDDLLAPDHKSPASQPPDQPSKMTFYVHSLKLLQILGDILDSFYSQEPDQALNRDEEANTNQFRPKHIDVYPYINQIKAGNFQKLLRFDAALIKCQKGLPPYLLVDQGNSSPDRPESGVGHFELRDSPTSATTSLFKRQARTLRARFLHMRIFLLRPLLLVLYGDDRSSAPCTSNDDSVESMVQRATLVRVSRLCVSTAQELTDLIWKSIDSGNDSSFSWWYNVFYIYTCATVIHTGRLCPSIEDQDGGGSLKTSWDKCLQCLAKYSNHGQSARRCRRALQMVEKQAFHPTINNHSPNETIQRTENTSLAMPHEPENQGINSAFQQPESMAEGDWNTGAGSLYPGDGFDGDDNGAESIWMGDPEDLLWLTSMPFMVNLEEQ